MTEKEDREQSRPRYDGDTYVTSHKRRTGVGNEPEPIDLREPREGRPRRRDSND